MQYHNVYQRELRTKQMGYESVVENSKQGLNLSMKLQFHGFWTIGTQLLNSHRPYPRSSFQVRPKVQKPIIYSGTNRNPLQRKTNWVHNKSFYFEFILKIMYVLGDPFFDVGDWYKMFVDCQPKLVTNTFGLKLSSPTSMWSLILK